MNSPKAHFLDMDRTAWDTWVAGTGLPRFRSQQIYEWIWQKRVFSPESMTNLSRGTRQQLAESLNWDLPTIDQRLDSRDGTTKLLFLGARNQYFEAVIMRYENRVTLCLSSQVGCKLACSFCQTGKLGFFRHLTAAEILGQYAVAENIVAGEGLRVSNVVFMGMGEPLDNYEHAVNACNRLIEPEFFGLSARHVTISTSGIAPKLAQLAHDTRASLAVSLHAATDTLRQQLMPINRRYPLTELKAAMQSYQQDSGRKITIEYILIKDMNSGEAHARDLVRFLQGLRCKVNLIPFNAHPGLPYQRPSDDEIRRFQEFLAQRSIAAPVRYSRGGEVSAACGQLAAKRESMLQEVPQRRFVTGNSTQGNCGFGGTGEFVGPGAGVSSVPVSSSSGMVSLPSSSGSGGYSPLIVTAPELS